MKVKTSDLIDAHLDWAVAKALGVDWFLDKAYVGKVYRYAVFSDNRKLFSPSTSWAQGGPIIEREQIWLKMSSGQWVAESPGVHEFGLTPLVAAMRCLVASKLGDTVDVLDTLVNR